MLALSIVALVVAWWFAYRDIKLSTRGTLGIEDYYSALSRDHGMLGQVLRWIFERR
ncbi:hypothetical protein GCM10007881_10490 [Mesorhizobium huakuii]|uniref:hypothetical protein n=1 Tax=Mesorhizobium huakuii TaxID=28104 RepID=UPI00235C49ED|nr:hypothetical protein [Mesorhizobium huakuii]GLQ77533.1 hypothetical protein GCM10007881_10490 [Mesorhizobium huakuii]